MRTSIHRSRTAAATRSSQVDGRALSAGSVKSLPGTSSAHSTDSWAPSATGSPAVGKLLLKRCADRVLKVGMELGGNAPFIVMDDADIDAAVDGAMIAKMRHSAEVCTAANRLFAHASVAEEFTDKLAAAMGALRVGNGMDGDTAVGPMINAEAAIPIRNIT